MLIGIILTLVICGLPSMLLLVDLVKYLISGRRLYNTKVAYALDVAGMMVLPIFFLIFKKKTNDCCSDSATFSPDHRLTINILVGICIITYFYSRLKGNLRSPVIEVLINAILLLGFVFNIFIAIQVGSLYWLFGNIPVGILFLFQLIENHKLFLELNKAGQPKPERQFENIAWNILNKNLLLKIPLLFIICLPILTMIASLLLIFGQKPDSIIRAFTDTYKHGFSELNHLCNNVQCGGHFLCSIAANGHKEVVKPIRYGVRNGSLIICNRQLLVANAFEELIEQKLPKAHKVIRKQYNKIGSAIHRHYHIFNNKLVSDCIYLLMKPLELLFLLCIYCCDVKPENRIAKQYLKKLDRQTLSKLENKPWSLNSEG